MRRSVGLASSLAALLLVIGVAGCEASAQNPELFEPSQPAPTTSVRDVAERRAIDTRAALFGEGLISDVPALVSSAPCAHDDAQVFALPNPALCDELEIRSLGTTYRAILLSRAHDVLVVVHEGHKVCAATPGLASSLMPDATELIKQLLLRADVLYVDMPMLGLNCGQIIDVKGIQYSGIMHNWLGLIDEPGRSGLAYFFDPLYWALSFVSPNYRAIHMTGRSGGGWATTLYAALDWRIQRSVSVAGSLPLELRTPELDGNDDIGDWEQYAAHIYKRLSYQELYEAAGGLGEPRRHTQIYNEFDICCFKGVKGMAAAAEYASSPKAYLQDRVRFLVNAGEREHTFAIDMVVEQLFGP